MRWANFEIDALEQAGFAASTYLRTRGFPVDREPGWARMPWAAVASMWKAAEKQTRDPNLGLNAAAKVSFAQPGFIAYAMLSGANLRETFGFLEEHQRLCIDGRILSIESRGRHDALCLHPLLDPTPSKHHAEFLFLIFTRACRHILGQDFTPSAVQLRRTVSPRAKEFTQAFGCPIYWDQAQDEMRIDVDWMLRPSPYSHPETMQTLRQRATQFMQQYTAPDWKARVKALVERMLPDGEASVQAVASNLGISPRTLQRRLADEGKTFDDIRDAARRARAMELVGKDRVPAASVANQLGFSDPRAFRRAFRRWTGTTPSELSNDKPKTKASAQKSPAHRRRTKRGASE